MAGPNPAAGIDIVQEFLPKPVSDFFVAPQGADPRVAEWFLLDSPVLPAVIGALYLLSIPVGKWFMRDREPVNVRSFATVHNAFLAGLSLYMVVETLLAVYDDFNWSERFTLWCNGVNRTGIEQNAWTKSGYRLASVLYVHYVSKAYEFVDTWLMIAKKNHRQISFLHVYHHSTTFFPVWYWNVTYAPGGDAWFCCFLNSLVHVFMYSHYLISGLGYKSPIRKFITLVSARSDAECVTFRADTSPPRALRSSNSSSLCCSSANPFTC